MYDAVVVGAGVAGSTAAALLARRGLNTVLVERKAKSTRKAHAPDWLCGPARALLEELGVDCTGQLGAPFAGITFHSADLGKTAQSAATQAPGWRIDYPRFAGSLLEAAAGAGATILNDTLISRIELRESKVCLELEGRDPLEGAFLVLADGAARTMSSGSTGPAVLGPVPSKMPGRWFATIELAAPARGRDPRDENMHWLLGLDRGQACCLWWWDGSTAVVSMLAGGTGESTTNLLRATVDKLIKAGLIACKDAVDPATVGLRPAPARSALEIDSHVEKRCLIIGDAGGFVGETSGEGICPAAWSARLAVDSIAAAMTSPHPQDQLRQFSTTWRSSMAEYLRPPNTDVHFLLPLIFSNRQMTDRMAAAFWKGQNI